MADDSTIYEKNVLQTESETDTFTPDRYRQFAAYLCPTDVVLDIGCNTGRGGLALVAARPGLVIDGLEMLSERRAVIPGGIYRDVYADMSEVMSYRHGQYDAAVLGEVIEHVPYAELDKFVVEILDVVKPGGSVLLTTPNPHSLLARLRRRSVLGGAHVSVHCAVALAQLFRHHGAEKVTVRGTGKTSRFLGVHFPLACYGSFLMKVETKRG